MVRVVLLTNMKPSRMRTRKLWMLNFRKDTIHGWNFLCRRTIIYEVWPASSPRFDLQRNFSAAEHEQFVAPWQLRL